MKEKKARIKIVLGLLKQKTEDMLDHSEDIQEEDIRVLKYYVSRIERLSEK